MSAKYRAPKCATYDIVIVGGAMMGASTAWFLSQNPDFDGRVLVVEQDPTYEFSSTALSNSCMRQQFSNELNVRISQFAADFVHNLRDYMGGDERVPALRIQNFGYMYLADNDDFADTLRASHKVQVKAGAGTKLLTPDEIKTAFPFYNVDDIVLASHNTVDEGYFDGITVFDWFRRSAREAGVEYVTNEVVSMTKNAGGDTVESVTLSTGETISCGKVVNASGPRAVLTSRMAGIEIPVEPRKRYTWIFTAEQSLDRVLPLTIDPSGVHFRQDGTSSYMAGGHADVDPRVDSTDFGMDHSLWEHHIWPAIAARVPQFEAIKVQREWVGHYAYNTFDHNAITGAHHEVTNFHFLNGFSGHGLQQSPAMGRATSELLVYGEYRSLNMTPFDYSRIIRGERFVEKAVI
jgi:glycine/D-amino acid oxidase-like deaminating enzyme